MAEELNHNSNAEVLQGAEGSTRPGAAPATGGKEPPASSSKRWAGRRCCQGSSKFRLPGQKDAWWAGARMALISLLSCMLFLWDLDLTPAIQASNTSWIFITSMIVGSSAGDCLGQAMLKASDRVLGTCGGSILGSLMAGVTYWVSLLGPPWVERLFVTVGLTVIVGLAFYAMTDTSARWAFVRTHQYAFLAGVITLGLVWLTLEQAYRAHGPHWKAISRLTAIIIGSTIGVVVLSILHPGAAITVIHDGLSSMSRSMSVMIQDLCKARIEQQPLGSLTEVARRGFKDDDPIRTRYRTVQDKVGKLRSLLYFIQWEPRCLYPAHMRPGIQRAAVHYRLLIGRISRINATAMAMDVQLRTIEHGLTRLRPAVSAATESLTNGLAELLQDAAKRLEQVTAGEPPPAPEMEEELSELEGMVQLRLEELSRAAHGNPCGQHSEEAELRGYLQSLCGPVVEAEYMATAGPAFIFLMMQLSMQVLIYFDDVIKLVKSRHRATRGGEEEEEEESEDERGAHAFFAEDGGDDAGD